MLRLITLSVFMIGICTLFTNPTHATYIYQPGDTIADFEGIHADGVGSSNLYDFKGEFTVLAMSATWCVPCEDAAKVTDEILANLSSNGFDVNWIEILGEEDGYFQRPASVSAGISWADNAGLDYDEVWIGAEASAAFEKFLGIVNPTDGYSIPWFIVLDRNMVMAEGLFGFQSATELSGRIQAVLTPEPSTAVLGLMAIGMVATRRRRS